MSSQISGVEVALSPVNEGAEHGGGGVAQGAAIVAFVDATMADDDGALKTARTALRAVLSDEAFVDTCATIGAFNVVDRIADATGIPLDDSLFAMSESVRGELDLARFGSSANTRPERWRY